MKNFFVIAQLITAFVVIALILLQQRGSSLSGLFGGGGEVYRTKRGMEKVIFIATIIAATLFLGSGIAIITF